MLTLFHGSSEKVIKPDNTHNNRGKGDYGVGFYLAVDYESSIEWGAKKAQQFHQPNSIVGTYSIDLSGLSIFDFGAPEFDVTVIEWLATVAESRKCTAQSIGVDQERFDWLISHSLRNRYRDFDDYDVYVGYRVDDDLYTIIPAFLNGNVNLETLEYLMQCGNLGIQYCMHSDDALQQTHFISAVEYPVSDYINAYWDRYNNAKFACSKTQDYSGIFIDDVLEYEEYEKRYEEYLAASDYPEIDLDYIDCMLRIHQHND